MKWWEIKYRKKHDNNITTQNNITLSFWSKNHPDISLWYSPSCSTGPSNWPPSSVCIQSLRCGTICSEPRAAARDQLCPYFTKLVYKKNTVSPFQQHIRWVDNPLFVGWPAIAANKTNKPFYILNSFVMFCVEPRGPLIALFVVISRPLQIYSAQKTRYQSEHVSTGMCEGDCIDVSSTRWISKRDALNLNLLATAWRWNAWDWEWIQCQHSLDKALNEAES